MKILIITQKIDKDDDNLGFFSDWLDEFANHADQVLAICLYRGKYKPVHNVKVLSLGKEMGLSRFKYLINFYKYIFFNRNEYDVVFVHMNAEYVILGSPVWKLMNKKVGLWYVHKSVDWKLRLAEKFTDVIFTASPESFHLPSKKVKIFGHGINLDLFRSLEAHENTNIISVGRISPVKNYELLIDAARIMNDRGVSFDIKIAGSPVMETDKKYLADLKKKVKENGLDRKIHFLGSVPHEQIIDKLSKSKVLVNLSETGSLDKAVLEGMSAGLLVLTSNEAFRSVVADNYFTIKDPMQIANKLILLLEAKGDPNLSRYVSENHDLKKLISNIICAYA